ncbi:hypothetical protein Y032_0373g175 [Ancylostoma ceylanicum]|uniref:Uncharacterized protein n=1 Tax=Ancylostoma ceylanicum TaxID=53326 RepID=A0A016RUL9_9BILA|nr:hypothetical protein Y032_0373g175 [Ancylostoma ceylanicum]
MANVAVDERDRSALTAIDSSAEFPKGRKTRKEARSNCLRVKNEEVLKESGVKMANSLKSANNERSRRRS